MHRSHLKIEITFSLSLLLFKNGLVGKYCHLAATRYFWEVYYIEYFTRVFSGP